MGGGGRGAGGGGWGPGGGGAWRGRLTVKGRRARVTVYELLGAYGAEDALAPTPEQEALARQTRAAFDALITNDHALAKELFEAILQTYPAARVVRLQLDRLAAAVADVPETA